MKLNSPVLLNWHLAILSCIAKLLEQYRESTLPISISQEGQGWICSWECLYCDLSRKIRWNIAWALGKSLRIFLGLRLYFIVYPFSRHNTSRILKKTVWKGKIVYMKKRKIGLNKIWFTPEHWVKQILKWVRLKTININSYEKVICIKPLCAAFIQYVFHQHEKVAGQSCIRIFCQ